MALSSRVIERLLGLDPGVTRDVRARRNLPVRARDGAVLLTDHYEPRLRNVPTILIRTPYGRGGVIGLISGRTLAEQGFNVVLQSCRGTFGSSGTFDPMRHEREDGLDTIDWIKTQSWFNGDLFTYGPSYVGFTQWAVAPDAGPELKGMLTAVTASAFRDPTYAGGAYSLDTILNWATLTHNQRGGSMLSYVIRQSRAQPRLREAWKHLPLSELDGLVNGREIAFFQEWLAHSEPGDPYWQERIHDARVGEVRAAVCMVGGWYDIFLPWQLRDYAALRAAGARPRLVIGGWTHADLGLLAHSMREGVSWFRAMSNGGRDRPGGVRVQVGPDGEWRDLPDWPPHPGTTNWFLHPGGNLRPEPPTAGAASDATPDRFRYDPNDPTPSPGGALFTKEGGRRDNQEVEARPDILVYTGPYLDRDVEAIGPVSATVHFRSSLDHFDVYVRVCDVDPVGRSWNVCDGLVRVTAGRLPTGERCPTDADGVQAVEVELWPTAYRFRAGHRIRVQVASGAHPRYARNPGTGEPLGTATELRPADQEVYADAAHPSAIRLPY